MVRSKIIRVHPLFYDALDQMRRDLEKMELQIFTDTELTRRVGLRMRKRREEFYKKNKKVFNRSP